MKKGRGLVIHRHQQLTSHQRFFILQETICYTQAFDQWVRTKMKDDEGYWENLGVEPSSWYFGSHTGAFRIWPARQSINCHDYDARLRPWYVAASSGPKNIVMVLDTSRSMFGLRMELLKDAAKRVVNTLTVGDRIAIVPFSTDPAQPLADKDGYMLIATRENKDWLINQIDKLEAGGRTNFYDAFVTAFKLLAMSVEEEYTVNCNTAILFLTDGEMTEPKDKTEQDVLDLVSSRISDISTLLSKPVMLFTYSVSEQEEVHALPSRLACTTEWGVWSKVTADVEIVESLASYYRLFALGLGASQNDGFAAWVEPYAYYTGGVLGTTVSTPVYDRSKQPHVFLGVAAVDLRLAALDAALGIAPERGSQESINRIALVSTARCPTLELELCELESFRRNGAAGDEALCTTNCTEDDFVQIEEESCPFVTQYPSELWVNDDYMGLSYEDRVCCLVGESFPSDQCPLANNDNDDSTKTTIIIGSAVGGGVLLILCACVYWFYWRDEELPPAPQIEAVSEPPQTPEPELESAATPKEPGTNASRTLMTEDHSST